MKVCVLAGGAGYIGSFIVLRFLELDLFDQIYVIDIRDPETFESSVTYLKGDVRKPITLELPAELDTENSWVFNLAAVHREPGHTDHEYFDTNINGAKNINDFLEKSGIQNLYFTSSIAPYGRSREQRDESSPCYPETPYGMSKWQVEAIHEIWLRSSIKRRLIITRPTVIYGPGDPGNVLRMIQGIKKGTFFIPGNPAIVKGHGYIHGLIDSVLFTMGKQDALIIYNYAENPCIPLGEMVAVIKNILGIKRPVPRVPLWLLVWLARLITLVWKSSPIHPVRVKNVAFPTNIRATYLIENGFDFKYGFEKSLVHWKKEAPGDY